MGCCERSDGTPGSIKCGEFLDYLKNCYFLKKGSAVCSSYIYIYMLGYAVAQLVEPQRYKSEGRGFDS